MAIIYATDASFKQDIESGVVLVDFWAPWCGPCRMLEPIIERISKAYEGKLKVVKLNTDENEETPSSFQISGIPTMIVFQDGKMVDKIVGAYPEEAIREMLDKYIK